MRSRLTVLALLLGLSSAAPAEISVGIGLSVPGLSIGIHVPSYPQLARVPGYPVYYAPGLSMNFFFYDGLYWVLRDDNWYASSWYDGPWSSVAPEVVPAYLLRVPVRYYRAPPSYFSGWRRDAPPRWDERWGPSWQQQRRGWDRWERGSVPPPAPLPSYQRPYQGSRYPDPQRQPELRSQHYPYQPREDVVRQHYEATAPGRAQAGPPRTAPPGSQYYAPRETQRAYPGAQDRDLGRQDQRGADHDRDRERDRARGNDRRDERDDRGRDPGDDRRP